MNNSFDRLIDGMCATLRTEVLARIDDEFARGQVFGVINLLNTFKVRADWSAEFLLQQIAVQRKALEEATQVAGDTDAADSLPAQSFDALPTITPIEALLSLRDSQNLRIVALLDWLDAERVRLEPGAASRIDALLRDAMREELAIELRNSPRPLFAEMSSGQEG